MTTVLDGTARGTTRHADLVLDVHGVQIGIRADDGALALIGHSYRAFQVDPTTVDPTVVLTLRTVGGRSTIDDGGPPILTVPERDGPVALFDTVVGNVQAGLFARDIVPIHAGAVGTAAGAIVIAGPSGAGKSTQVLALLRRGARFGSDELALLAPDDRTILPFPRAVHVRPATLELLPELAVLQSAEPVDLGGGAEWAAEPSALHAAFGSRAAGPAPLVLVVLLDGAPDGDPRPRPVDVPSAVAVMDLLRGAPSAAFDFRATMGRLAAATAGVRCVRLRPGALDATATAILDVAAELER